MTHPLHLHTGDYGLSSSSTAVDECSQSEPLKVCSPGGYLEAQGYDIEPVRAIIPGLQRLLKAFREAGFPVYHTREGR